MTESFQPSIVVGIDGSTESLAALRWAMQEAVTRGASVEVVHCWQPRTFSDLALSTPHELSRASICMLDNEVAAALQELAVKPKVTTISIYGRPATALLNRAADGQLLVLGSQGHMSLQDLVFGRVVNHCIRNAACPVVVVDSDQRAVTHMGRQVVTTG
jgi:nucleotide-binding universal stress UspA family protein